MCLFQASKQRIVVYQDLSQFFCHKNFHVDNQLQSEHGPCS